MTPDKLMLVLTRLPAQVDPFERYRALVRTETQLWLGAVRQVYLGSYLEDAFKKRTPHAQSLLALYGRYAEGSRGDVGRATGEFDEDVRAIRASGREAPQASGGPGV